MIYSVVINTLSQVTPQLHGGSDSTTSVAPIFDCAQKSSSLGEQFDWMAIFNFVSFELCSKQSYDWDRVFIPGEFVFD